MDNDYRQRRLDELNEQRRGCYDVELKVRMLVFAQTGNDYYADRTWRGVMHADSGADAYRRAVQQARRHPDELARGGVLHAPAPITSHGYRFRLVEE